VRDFLAGAAAGITTLWKGYTPLENMPKGAKTSCEIIIYIIWVMTRLNPMGFIKGLQRNVLLPQDYESCFSENHLAATSKCNH